jgi:hypothetical protein
MSTSSRSMLQFDLVDLQYLLTLKSLWQNSPVYMWYNIINRKMHFSKIPHESKEIVLFLVYLRSKRKAVHNRQFVRGRAARVIESAGLVPMYFNPISSELSLESKKNFRSSCICFLFRLGCAVLNPEATYRYVASSVGLFLTFKDSRSLIDSLCLAFFEEHGCTGPEFSSQLGFSRHL